jgi:hypothetical protein
VSRVKAESTAALASTRKETESLVQNITLLKGEFVEVSRACPT